MIWEAQFGDFVNGAQSVIDEYLSSGEAKWGQQSGVVLLLPHGHEGQGPDHTSGRIERFLQLCAEGSMTVAVPSTPANYFHLLRRHILDGVHRPMVVFTPKSMLRNKAAVSAVADFTSGKFESVIADSTVDPAQVKTLLLTTGKFYYELDSLPADPRHHRHRDHPARTALPGSAAPTRARLAGLPQCHRHPLGPGGTRQPGRLDVPGSGAARTAAENDWYQTDLPTGDGGPIGWVRPSTRGGTGRCDRRCIRTADAGTDMTSPAAAQPSQGSTLPDPHRNGVPMTTAPYELLPSSQGLLARIHTRGSAVLSSPTINRGTAFTLQERRALGLTGLLPTGVSTLESQLRRVYAQYLQQANDLRKWVYLANLRDRNEVLFYRLLTDHLSEMRPVVYTPTVGLAIERFSHEFRRPRGVYLSVYHPEDVETAFRNTGLGRRTTLTYWWRQIPKGSSGSVTKALAESRSPSASSPATPPPPESTPDGYCPSSWTWEPTISNCSTTICTWVNGMPEFAASATTI